VADETLVPRDVDESHDALGGKLEVRKPELDRDPPALLLDEAVGVNARERLDDRALAVIDVPGGPDHEVAHVRPDGA
jgi:hypothetical protein